MVDEFPTRKKNDMICIHVYSLFIEATLLNYLRINNFSGARTVLVKTMYKEHVKLISTKI